MIWYPRGGPTANLASGSRHGRERRAKARLIFASHRGSLRLVSTPFAAAPNATHPVSRYSNTSIAAGQGAWVNNRLYPSHPEMGQAKLLVNTVESVGVRLRRPPQTSGADPAGRGRRFRPRRGGDIRLSDHHSLGRGDDDLRQLRRPALEPPQRRQPPSVARSRRSARPTTSSTTWCPGDPGRSWASTTSTWWTVAQEWATRPATFGQVDGPTSARSTSPAPAHLTSRSAGPSAIGGGDARTSIHRRGSGATTDTAATRAGSKRPSGA